MSVATSARIPNSKHGPCADTYTDVTGLIYKAVIRFRRKYGHNDPANLEDMLSEAKIGYMRAYSRFDYRKGNFGARVQYVVFHHLLDKARHIAPRKAVEPLVVLDEPQCEEGVTQADMLQARRSFCVNSFSSDLSKDACKVIRALFAFEHMHLAYGNAKKIAKDESNEEESDNRNKLKRRSIIRFLRKLGWNADRIHKAFAEISQALNS